MGNRDILFDGLAPSTGGWGGEVMVVLSLVSTCPCGSCLAAFSSETSYFSKCQSLFKRLKFSIPLWDPGSSRRFAQIEPLAVFFVQLHQIANLENLPENNEKIAIKTQ